MTPKPVRMKMPTQRDQTEQLQRPRQRHVRRSKEGKDRMLDKFCEQHGYHCKHAIKLLGDVLPKVSSQSPPGPEPRYQAERRLGGTLPRTLLCKQTPIGATPRFPRSGQRRPLRRQPGRRLDLEYDRHLSGQRMGGRTRADPCAERPRLERISDSTRLRLNLKCETHDHSFAVHSLAFSVGGFRIPASRAVPVPGHSRFPVGL